MTDKTNRLSYPYGVMINVDHAQAMKTLNEYNAACARGGSFNPAVLDGLFHYNYPLGTGLMSGAVFGRIAGRRAARS